MRIVFPHENQSRLDTFFAGQNGALSPEQEPIPDYGASLRTKEETVFRVATQNPNGVRAGTRREGAEELDAMETLGIDAMGLAETNLNLSHNAKMELSALIRMQFGTGSAITSSSSSTDRTEYQQDTSLVEPPCTYVGEPPDELPNESQTNRADIHVWYSADETTQE